MGDIKTGWATDEEFDAALEDRFNRPMTWADARRLVDEVSDYLGEWEGVPVPLGDDTPMVLRPGHPMEFFHERRAERTCTTDDVREDERVVNHWVSRRRNVEVFVVERGGRYSAVVRLLSPNRSMERLTLALSTLSGCDAWDLAAEHKAREHLRGMLNEQQWRTYDLTGVFCETSLRSGLTYVFRRLRPTVVMSPHTSDGHDGPDRALRCIAVLCCHPIGLYANTFAGCMCPTDDVIAHLSMMRGDEPFLWRKAVQHQPWEPEAGL